MKAKLLTILGIFLFSVSFTACSEEEINPKDLHSGGTQGEMNDDEFED